MSTRTSVQRQVDQARSLRFAVAPAAVIDVFLIAVNLAREPAAAIVPAVLLALLLVLVLAATRVIRTLEREQQRELARPRMTLEDYRHLREMEAGLGWELSEIPADVAEPAGAARRTAISWECECGPAERRKGASTLCSSCMRYAAGHFGQLRVSGASCFCPVCAWRAEHPVGWAPPVPRTATASELAASPLSGTGSLSARPRVTGQAKLPEALRETTIATMKPGCTYWAVPWAMRADEEGRLWLGAGYTAWPDRGGTAEMRVELREDGVHAWVVKGEAYARVTGGGPEGVPVAVLEGMAGEASLGDAAVRDRIAGMVAKAADAPSYALARSDREIAAARAAEHFAALARVGLEHCLSYCPICLYRLFGPMPDGVKPDKSMWRWTEENWGWKR